jgi:hypothetical protein
MIKIVAGYSYPSESTLALVNLCNQFNSRGYACTLYGPDIWHADKCKSGNLSEFSPEPGDIIVVNDVAGWPIGDLLNVGPLEKKNRRKQLLRTLKGFLIKFLPSIKPSNYKLILTCQEGKALPSLLARISRFNKIHFTGRTNNVIGCCFRMAYPTFVAPNFSNGLNMIESRLAKTAGVIEDIEKENKIEVAIEQALMDGMETVIIFGAMKDPEYYYGRIAPLTRRYLGKIKYAGFIDDRQKMYGTVSHVYSATKKPCGLVSHECAMTSTMFHAPESSTDDCRMTNDQIFEVWKHELAI